MNKSQRLRFGDIRRAGRLVGEVRELGDNPAVWRAHALSGLAALARGQVAIAVDLDGAFPGQAPRLIDPIDLGWGAESDRLGWVKYKRLGVGRRSELLARRLADGGRPPVVLPAPVARAVSAAPAHMRRT